MRSVKTCDCERVGIRGILCPTEFDDVGESKNGRVWVSACSICDTYSHNADATIAMAKIVGTDPSVDLVTRRMYLNVNLRQIEEMVNVVRKDGSIIDETVVYEGSVSWACSFDRASSTVEALRAFAAGLSDMLRDAIEGEDDETLARLIDRLTEAKDEPGARERLIHGELVAARCGYCSGSGKVESHDQSCDCNDCHHANLGQE